MSKFTETHVEDAALAWVSELGYAILHGPDIAPDSAAPERTSYDEVILPARLSAAVARLNRNIPAEVQAEAIRRLHLAEYPALTAENRRLHRYLVEGVPVDSPDRTAPSKATWCGWSISPHRSKMTGWPSTSSPSSSRKPTADRISCCSSTACP